jgi:hypothetical protein
MTNLVFLVKAGLPILGEARYANNLMRYSETLCRRAAEKAVTALVEKDLVRLRTDKKSVSEKVTAAFLENFRQEEALEKEAERVADEHLRTMTGLDRHKVVQLIKQRLAEERKFVL